MEKKVTILGINGGFGQLFSVLLSNEKQTDITGVDLAGEINKKSKCSVYVQSDLTVEAEKISEIITNSDLVIICLPEDIAYKFFSCYERQISKTTLLIDTLSIKNAISSIYIKNDLNALSLNPMFGPDLTMDGKNIIVIKFKETTASDNFIAILKTWQLNVVYLTAEEHDKMTSVVQAATHAAIIAFGATLKEFDIPITDLFKIATPPFSTMSALFGRIVSGNKKVYWNIQNENIYAAEARRMLLKNLVSLDKSVIDKQEDEFYKMIEPATTDQKDLFENLAKDFSNLFKSN